MKVLTTEFFRSTIRPRLKEEMSYESISQVPRMEKVVLNVGAGEAKTNKNLLSQVLQSLGVIGGQKAVSIMAKKSVSGFKLREGMTIGAKLTLRKERMYDFLTRLVHVYIPRIKDFNGLSPRSFDGRGNWTLGIGDMRVFPELPLETADQVPGISITLVTTANDQEGSLALFKAFGLPFSNL